MHNIQSIKKSLNLCIFFCLSVSLYGEEFFVDKIEPILRSNCYECHSHGKNIKAGLALDSRSGWNIGGDSGPAIIPGEPEKSLLLKMVKWTDEDHQMPPKKKLSQIEIDLLEEWVSRGAHDPRKINEKKDNPLDWWSLKPLQAPSVPDRVHPIDFLVRKSLKEVGIKPSPRADKRTLVRRINLNLHGMLPAAEEVQEFVENDAHDSWVQLIDALLASPRYGERWARHWLDVIHFADSHGCEHDVKRPNAWRYRDYVIERMNEDVPWGRFIREQLAPGVFFPNEPRLLAGLGFIAAGPLEASRAGTAPLTFDYLDRDDIVNQTMSAFVSTTANCARCHNHKFDPITQEDYYSLQAVFAGVGKGDVEFEADSETMRLREEVNFLLTALEKRDANVLLQDKYIEYVRAWELEWKKNPPSEWKFLDPVVFVSSGGSALTRQDDNSLFASGPMGEQEQYTITSKVDLKKMTAVRIEALKDKRLPKGGPGRAHNGNFHVSEVDLHWFPDGGKQSVELKVIHASADFDQQDWTSKHAIDGDEKSGWAIFPRVNESHHIILELDKAIDTSRGGSLAVTIKQLWPPEHYIGRVRISVTDAADGSVRHLSKAVKSGLLKPITERSKEERIAIASAALEDYANNILTGLPKKEVVYGVSNLWSHNKKLETAQLEPKPVHLLKRGDIDKPVREVVPGAISIMSHLPGRFDLSNPKNESSRRAALADWIAHKENTLTWRSIVNRVWYYHFGRGLCDTLNDFGRMGNKPTHPELLDWLAIWFRDEAKGSLKKLHRLILTSETWQQKSMSDVSAIDTDNRYFWRFNRRRLDAESFRDSALAISGRIDLKMGGPGIEQFLKTKGPQDTPSLDYTKFNWNKDDARRRSIYRVVWRGIPDPFMEALDFPDMGLLAPKRTFSVSSLQSLALYNNPFVLHASEWISERVVEESKKDNHVSRLVELCWQRAPTESERLSFEEYSKKHGLNALCRVLLNSNEFLFVD